MTVVNYVQEDCVCIRHEESHSVSCRCEKAVPSIGKPVCDPLRREYFREETLQEWRDDLNQCVDVVKRITYPHGKRLTCSLFILCLSAFIE